MTHSTKIYYSQTAYETNTFLGVLSRLYFKASEMNPDEHALIKNLLNKIKSEHIETPHIKGIAKAMKSCLLKEMDFNYENLSRTKEFLEIFKDKDSFLTTLSYQIIPTAQDIRVYLDALERKDSNKLPVFDIVLKDTEFAREHPGLAEVISSVRESVGDDRENRFQTTGEVLDEYEVVERRRDSGEGFYTTGFSAIDKYLTEGFAPKKVTILAGRPGMGKSAFAVNIMKNLAYQKIHTAQLVLEMDKISFMDRLISSMSMIDLDKLVKNRDMLTANEKATTEFMKQRLRNNPYLHLNDKPSPTIAAAKKMIQELQMRIGQKYLVLVIDLVDKLKDVLSGSENMQASFHLTLNSLQTMAKELDIHLILVAQINRDSEKKSDKRPTLVNLKHSGAFEEVADLIFFVDRPSYRLMDEDTAEVDTQFDKVNLMDSFDYQSAEKYVKKYENHDMFDTEDDHLTKGRAKDDKKELAKHLKADKMMQVGNVILPIEQYAELILAKQRQGTPNKIIPFIFKGPYSSFTSMHLVSSYTE